jgi:hypothetical protein
VRVAFGKTPGVLVALLLVGILAPVASATQGAAVTAGTRQQMKASAALRPADTSSALEQGGGEGLRSDSTYNWGAAFIGMGVGAVVGAAIMGFGGAESSEIPVGAGMVAGALLFGIFGFFVGYAIGNHD